MVHLILGVLLVFFVQTLVPAILQYMGGPGRISSKLLLALGPRDTPPARSAMTERAYKALENLFEALPIFLTLALLSIMLGVEQEAWRGAAIFLVARVFYLPTYISGIPGLRSFVWTVGLFGLLVMLGAILPAAGNL